MRLVAADLAKVEKAIELDTVCSVDAVTAISRHLQASGGKRLRPLLVLLTAKALGVDDLVVPTDWLDGDDLQRAYAATDVFVTPSICFDTFGLVNLEAMEHAKPVVATVFGGSQEVVQHGETGFIANPLDVEGYAARIRELLRDPELARRMGEAGRERMRAHFTVDRLTDEYLEEYERARAAASGALTGSS